VTPRVSVVVPTRNRLAMLRRALSGVEAQRFRDFEVIVVDDGSVDGTAEWLRTDCPEVRLVASATPGGAAAARNRALDSARGELVAFLDSDDVWQPSYLEEQVAHLDANPELALSHADHVESDPDGRTTRPSNRSLLPDANQLVHLLAEAYIHTLSVVVCRRDAFEQFGRFDEGLAIVHDFDWYVRILAGGGAIAHLPRLLVERSVPGGLVTAHRRWFSEDRTVISRGLAACPEARPGEPMIRAYRALFFARVAFEKRDVTFGLARLAEALRCSPRWTGRLVALSLARRARGDRQIVADMRGAQAEAAR
jgi:glycosyltransferase involved in cell wall biosynthesis